MARVSIYISDELKARMTEAGDTLNWSDIARPAFEQAISNFSKMRGQAMSGIERLRASKKQFLEHVEKGAAKDGRKWASDVASFYELRAVSEINLENYEVDHSGILAAMYNATDPERDLSYDIWLDSIFGNEHVTDEWAYHFANAAQEFYDEVKDEI